MQQRPALAREVLNVNTAETGDSWADFLFPFYSFLFNVLVSIPFLF